APPPLGAARLHPGEPATGRVERRDDPDPGCVHDAKPEAETGWEEEPHREERPRVPAPRGGHRDGERMDHVEVHDVEEEWHAAEGDEHVRGPGAQTPREWPH